MNCPRDTPSLETSYYDGLFPIIQSLRRETLSFEGSLRHFLQFVMMLACLTEFLLHLLQLSGRTLGILQQICVLFLQRFFFPVSPCPWRVSFAGEKLSFPPIKSGATTSSGAIVLATGAGIKLGRGPGPNRKSDLQHLQFLWKDALVHQKFRRRPVLLDSYQSGSWTENAE